MTPHAYTHFTLQAAPRAEHETLDQCAGRTGERPGEGLCSLRQRLLSDVGQTSGPSRYVSPWRAIRHAWAGSSWSAA
jgi:hypothetical protein